MKLKTEHRRKARTIWQTSMNEKGMPDFFLLKKFISELVSSRSRNKEQILAALRDRIKLFMNGVKVRITSAEELSDSEKQRILDVISDAEKFLAEPEFAIDPSLLAGVKVEKGYEILDRSLVKQLETAKEKILSA